MCKKRIKLNPQFKKHLLIILIIWLLTSGGIELLTSHYTVMVSRKEHRCLPWTYFVLNKHEMPKERGDLIAFKGRGIPRFADGVRFVKMVAGMPGDVITVEVFSEEERNRHTRVIEKEGMMIKQRLQGRVYLHRKVTGKTLAFDATETDSSGKPLPVIQAQVIPEGKFFAVGTVERTYDSRYWGLVDEKQVIGQAYPLAFWKSTKGYI
ncbi:MAG: S26 family signal peptidase [Nitrospirota bacterium]